jgi:hypothetical protein
MAFFRNAPFNFKGADQYSQLLRVRRAKDPRDDHLLCESRVRRPETGVVKLHDEPVELPYYLSLPVERLDLEQAKQSMADDGHTPT